MKTWIEISASALRHNYQRVAQLVAPARVMATVKANAYGHGLREVAEGLQGIATDYVVDRVEEGILLRTLGITEPILVLGYVDQADLVPAVEQRLTLAVFDLSFLQLLRFTTQEHGLTADVHLEVETGLHRTGLTSIALEQVLTELQTAPQIHVTGLFSHFADVEDDRAHTYAQQQCERFLMARAQVQAAGYRPLCHMACSAAVFGFEPAIFDAVRLGISLYGLWSSDLTRELTNERGLDAHTFLQPVLRWKTVVSHVDEVKAGEPIGYDRTEVLTRDSRIATLPVGYYDGFSRALSSNGMVMLHGQRCRVIGRVCMNVCMVDVTDIEQPIAVGDVVTLIGDDVRAEEQAERAGTIHYEFVTRLSVAIPRVFVDQPETTQT